MEQVEQVKTIDGFENYTISESGEVKNIKTKKIIQQRINQDGYFKTNVYRDGERYTIHIHRLIARAFIPNPDNLPCVDHINQNKCDNRIENLRWVTVSENGRNRIGYKTIQYVYINILPESCVAFNNYNGHQFNNYFIDTIDNQIYEFNGLKYRKINPGKTNYGDVYYLQNIFHKNAAVSVNQLKKNNYNK